MKHDYRAIGAVVNIWTAEMIAMAWKHDNVYYNPWTTPVENTDRSALQARPLLYKWAFSRDHNHPHGPEGFEDTMLRRGDEAGHDNEHKSDGRRHDLWHGHLHHAPGSPHTHADGTTHSHD